MPTNEPLVRAFRYGGLDFRQVTTHTPDESYPISDLKLFIDLGKYPIVVTIGRATASYRDGQLAEDYGYWHAYTYNDRFLVWLVNKEPQLIALIKQYLTERLAHV